MPKYNVIIPNDVQPKPEIHEIEAAEIISKYFKSDVKFLRRGQNKSPDILIVKDNIRWEIKSPTGKGKHNIQHNVQDAARQSANIVIDSRRSKIHQTKFNNELQRQFNIVARVKKVLLITKRKIVVAFTK